MHHLTFCIASVFDIWPCKSKFEQHGASEGLRHLKAAICQKHTAGWCCNGAWMPGLQAFCLTLLLNNIYIASGHAAPRTYMEHKKSKNFQRVELCVFMRRKYKPKDEELDSLL